MIRVVYSEAPNFPATAQHPDAVRYKIGKWIVDAIGKPTLAEVEAFVNPPAEKVETVADLKAALIAKGTITEADVAAVMK